jgi:primosomal protein N' (replication factor Y)
MSRYADIVFNLPLFNAFTYEIPSHLIPSAEAGKRVLVRFGRKDLTGIITNLKDTTDVLNTRYIKDILDDEPIITKELFGFSQWVVDYYLAPLGEVLFSSIPRNINLKSIVTYNLSDNYKFALDNIKKGNEILIKIVKIFEESDDLELTINQLEKRLNSKELTSYIKILIDAFVLEKNFRFNRVTKEKIVRYYKLCINKKEVEDSIKDFKIRSEKQIAVLNALAKNREISQKDLMLLTGISSTSLKSLIDKELVGFTSRRVFRKASTNLYNNPGKINLNDEQLICIDEIKTIQGENKFNPILLFGVTGSGKTEIYIRTIQDILNQNKTAIVLVPEISLTPQLIARFKERFGDIIGVIHSKVSEGERLDTFDRILNNEIKIIIGARSAIFSPLQNIGIIIVDEEHDSSYKQENSPRYNGRDVALMRGKLNESLVILGSATPSIESFYNAEKGKYKLCTLKHRATKIKPPEIKIVNTQKTDKDQLNKTLEQESEKVKQDFFDFINKVRLRFISKELLLEIDNRLNKKEQIILLQNRRGFHSYIECLNCYNVEFCPRCNIALTYHKSTGTLKCHYCGYSKSMISKCNKCGSSLLVYKGAGTEKVEEELEKIFPKANLARLDSDSASSKKYYESVLNDFYNGKIDILVGTQLISKGLDFPNVTLVGVVNADIGLLNPDFRATEHTFQILTQVSGRAGRKDKEGEVIIQTKHPEYYVFEDIKNHDYMSFYKKELMQRETCDYPPFSRLVLIETKSENQLLAESKIKELYNFVKSIDREKKLQMLPPSQPLFSKLRDQYRYHLLIKSPKNLDSNGAYLNNKLKEIKNYSETIKGSIQILIDVDPLNLL